MRMLRFTDSPQYRAGVEYLLASQNDDGSWGEGPSGLGYERDPSPKHLVSLGRQLGVPTPVLSVICAALKPYANGAPG